MFAGPIIAREVLTAPRPSRYYVARAAFAGLLFILMWTAWQSLIGWRQVQDFGVLARFGGVLYLLFALLQLTLLLFFAPLSAATCCFSSETLVIRLPLRACRKNVRCPGGPTVPVTKRSGGSKPWISGMLPP